MPRGRSRFERARAYAAALPVAIAATLSCAGSSQDGAQSCQEAVAHLVDCCPGFDQRRFHCNPNDGFLGAQTPPLLGDQGASCIRNASCQKLTETGVCATLVRLSTDPSSQSVDIAREACR